VNLNFSIWKVIPNLSTALSSLILSEGNIKSLVGGGVVHPQSHHPLLLCEISHERFIKI
jgi:hypothetical protein